MVFDGYWDAPVGMSDTFPMELLVAGLPIGRNADELCTELARYPQVADAGVRTDRHLGPVGTSAEVSRASRPRARSASASSGPNTVRVIVRVLTPSPPSTARPGCVSSSPALVRRDFLSPIMLWLVLLFGLSSVARYDPELWVCGAGREHVPTGHPNRGRS